MLLFVISGFRSESVLFWKITQRKKSISLPTFLDNVSVSYSRVKNPRRKPVKPTTQPNKQLKVETCAKSTSLLLSNQSCVYRIAGLINRHLKLQLELRLR